MKNFDIFIKYSVEDINLYYFKYNCLWNVFNNNVCIYIILNNRMYKLMVNNEIFVKDFIYYILFNICKLVNYKFIFFIYFDYFV